MPHPPAAPQSDFQRQLVGRALALAQELERAAAPAPHGGLLDRCELLLLDQGRQPLRDALQDALGGSTEITIPEGRTARGR
jgi:hypothetical protein